MENNLNNSSQPKRIRSNPTRKWSVTEEKSLIDFLMENREFEKPTAQIYYKRFCSEKNVSIEWTQARSKMRNMRVSYNKAKAWEGSTGAGNMEGGTVKSSLLKMCTYFDELDDVFGSRIIEYAVIEDSLESGSEQFLNSTELFIDDTTTASDTSVVENVPSSSRKGIYSRTAVSDIMLMQTEVIEIKKQKFDYEKEVKNKEVMVMEKNSQLKERELDLKEKEMETQRELKIMEMETQKELKIMELKMKERVAMEELKLKYTLKNICKFTAKNA